MNPVTGSLLTASRHHGAHRAAIASLTVLCGSALAFAVGLAWSEVTATLEQDLVSVLVWAGVGEPISDLGG